MTFKLGDEVDWMGARGKVRSVDTELIWVVFDYGNKGVHTVLFFPDGREHIFHTEPSLKLINRPKKMEKITIERWVNVFHDIREGEIISTIYEVKSLADSYTGRRIACVKLTGEYEYEVEVE